jgi:hypothetical protein
MTAAISSALLILQTAAPVEDPPLLYPMYLLIIGAGLGAAAQRIILRRSSPWSAMFMGIIGSAIGGYLGIAVLGHGNIALSGGFLGAIVALAIGALLKRASPVSEFAADVPRTNPAPSVTPNFTTPKAAPGPVADPAPRPAQTSSQSGSGDIFISYASPDRPFAQRLAKALQSEGWSVWWDRVIPPGKTFDAVIEEALDSAKCVVVLWSASSVTSDWVKVEAAEAARRRILIPALIADATIPLEFRRIQAASLVDWTGPTDHPGFQSLATSIGELAIKRQL